MKQNVWQQGFKGIMVKNLPLMFLVLLIFAAGVAYGAIAINSLGYQEKQDSLDHLSTLLNGLAGRFGQSEIVSSDTIWLNVKTAGIIWLLGISTIGALFIPAIIFLRGFVIGFTVGFLVNEMGLRGLLFAFVSVLPQNLFMVPAVILAGTLAMTFSLTVVKSLVSKRPIDFGAQLLDYSVWMVLICAALVLASLIEIFVTPALMKLAAGLLLKN